MEGSDPVEGAGDASPPAGQPVYSIGAVGRMLGVPAATLRTWQERYGVVVPTRSEGGHRLYSRDQVEQLRFMANQVAAGLSAADAHRLLRDRLAGHDRTGRDRTGRDRAGAAPDVTPGAAPGAALDAAHGELRAPLPPPRQRERSLLILLAERDPHAAEFAEYFLRTEGYEVSKALDFHDALTKAQSRPDLVVLDLMVSAGRGVELCRLLTERGDAPPILAICTLALGDAALAAGAAAFLPKPVEPLRLVSAVQDLLGRSAFLRPQGAAP